MQDYTPEGMLKRIEQLENDRAVAFEVIRLHQATVDNLIECLEKLKPRVGRLEVTVDQHNDRIGNLEHPDN